MKRSLILLITAIISFHISGCGNETTINDDEASAVISDYLEEKSEYKTAGFEFGEMKFRENKDIKELNKYKALEDLGYITSNFNERGNRLLSFPQ